MEGLAYYYNWEVTLIETIQQHLGRFSTTLVSIFSMFGEEIALIAIMGLLYWCINKEAARFIGTNLMVGLIANPMLKNIVLRRRPYFDNPGIKCLKPVEPDADIYDIAAQGYSFPSGHSMNSAIMYGSLPIASNGMPSRTMPGRTIPVQTPPSQTVSNQTDPRERRKRILLIFAIIVPLLVGISRFALGVHYPTDVFAGWVLGAAILFLTSYLQRRVRNENLFHLILFLLALPGIFWCRTDDYFTGLGMMAGFFLSIPFERKYVNFKPARGVLESVLRVLGGFVVYFVCNTLMKLPFSEEFLSGGSMAANLVRSGRYMIVLIIMLGVYPMVFNLFDNNLRNGGMLRG